MFANQTRETVDEEVKNGPHVNSLVRVNPRVSPYSQIIQVTHAVWLIALLARFRQVNRDLAIQSCQSLQVGGSQVIGVKQCCQFAPTSLTVGAFHADSIIQFAEWT